MKLFCKFEAQKFLKCVCKMTHILPSWIGNMTHIVLSWVDNVHFSLRNSGLLTLAGNFEGKTNLFPGKGKPSEYIENIGHHNVKHFFLNKSK